MSGTIIVNQVSSELFDGYSSPLAKQDGYALTALSSGYLSMGKDNLGLARIFKVSTDGTLKIDGSDVTQPVSWTEQTVSVTQATATNLKAQAEAYQGGTAVGAANPLQVSLANTGSNATAIKVDGSAVTQPVSGTVTANAGTGNFGVNLTQLSGISISTGNGVASTGTLRVAIASDNTAFAVNAAQSGTWSSRTQDGYGSVITSHSAGSSRGIDVSILDGSGNQVTSFGGSQYIEDEASTGGESITLSGAIRQDTLSVTTSADGDYSNLKVNSLGRLYTSTTIDASLPAGTNAIGKLSANDGIDIGDVTINNSAGAAAVNIQDGGNSITVDNSGTFAVQAAQSGTWNINNISGTISLPSGAATETTLSSINTNTSGLSLSQGAATSGQKAVLIQGAVTTAAPIYTTGNSNPLSLTTAGALRVDGSATTQPVSGTVSITANSSVNLNQIAGTTTATGNGVAGAGVQRVAIASDNTAFSVNAIQSGTWNITNISGTISLPTGAATESSLAKLTLTQGSTTSGQSGALIQGAVTTAAPSYTTGQTSPVSLTTSGALRVDLGSTSANATAIKVDGSAVTQPVSGTVSITANSSVNLNQVAGNAVATGNGVATSGTQRVTIASDNTAFSVNSIQSGTWTIRSQDGYGIPLTASSIAPIGTETGLIVRNIPSGTQTVSGTVSVNGTASDNSANSSSKLPVIAALANTSAPTWTNGNMVPLSVDTSGALRIAGNITANNASVSTTASAPPASATYIGASVTTSKPTYTSGQMNALSLTTSGALRVDNISGSSTSSVTSVASSATNVTLLASNSNRVSAMIYNDSNQRLYIKFGATASTTSFTVQIAPGGYYEFPMPIWRGQVDGLWASANGSARITELT
jgi:hypothetical protein